MTEQKAKVFWSGRSQAVRIPKQFRFDTDEVTIRKEGDVVILEPVSNENQPIDFEKEWGWLDEIVGAFDDDFIRAVKEDPGEPTPRPDVDEFFK